MTVVRSTYRYKRPSRKWTAAALEVPAVVKAADPAKARRRGVNPSDRPTGFPVTRSDEASASAPPANDDRKPAIVTIRSRKHVQHAHLLDDLTPEEHQRRGDAADALFREIQHRIGGKT